MSERWKGGYQVEERFLSVRLWFRSAEGEREKVRDFYGPTRLEDARRARIERYYADLMSGEHFKPEPPK